MSVKTVCQHDYVIVEHGRDRIRFNAYTLFWIHRYIDKALIIANFKSEEQINMDVMSQISTGYSLIRSWELQVIFHLISACWSYSAIYLVQPYTYSYLISKNLCMEVWWVAHVPNDSRSRYFKPLSISTYPNPFCISALLTNWEDKEDNFKIQALSNILIPFSRGVRIQNVW